MLCGLDQQIETKEDEDDRLTKSAYFLAIREDYKMEKLARIYIDEIVAGNGVPVSIISNRDGRFTSRALANITESLKDAIGYEYSLSSSDGWIKSPVLWAEIEESMLIGPELVQETTNKVVLKNEKLKSVRDRQKSYADNRRKLLDFEVGDQVLLKVSPWKGVVHLETKTYANMHVHLEKIKVDKTLCFVEEPVEIINREVKSLKCSRIPIVKVYWNSKRGHEDLIKTKYPHLLVEQAIVGSTNYENATIISCTQTLIWDVIVNEDLEEEPAPTGETSASAPRLHTTCAKINPERVKSILPFSNTD
ncbi:hypothetical protein Tco_1361406 [Tanacetum coccineum]